MDRRSFLRTGCLACAAASVAPAVLTSCAGSRQVAGVLEGDALSVPADAFLNADGTFKRYVVVAHERLKQPIALFRRDTGYSALLMRCTHKGVELRVIGDQLECSAHGSTFNNMGAVLEGPASSPLRSFPAQEHEGRIHISLKA